MMSDNNEEFTIRLSLEGLPEELRVLPAQAGVETKYKLYNEDDYLGTVWSECIEEGLCWFSSDELPEDVVIKIGEAIETKDR
ncbi:hypothetical protein [Pedobacter sp. GR22-6]|uniref:hypothetical protein n=1 Tax=Pedobacter sp. GR22-6 TaxID=3127957 RepID=UPI00307DBBB3